LRAQEGCFDNAFFVIVHKIRPNRSKPEWQ